MKRVSAVATTLAIALATSGCFSTRATTTHQPLAAKEERQWFTLNGLVPLSEASARECRAGLARVESKRSASDILISVGIGVAGALAGAAACSGDAVASASCGSAAAWVLPLLIESRTVSYSCLPDPPQATAGR